MHFHNQSLHTARTNPSGCYPPIVQERTLRLRDAISDFLKAIKLIRPCVKLNPQLLPPASSDSFQDPSEGFSRNCGHHYAEIKVQSHMLSLRVQAS